MLVLPWSITQSRIELILLIILKHALLDTHCLMLVLAAM